MQCAGVYSDFSSILPSRRFLAWFLERIQMNFGVTSMWGGIGPDGRDRMQGYRWYDYLLASTGGENSVVAEASGDPTKGTHSTQYHNFSNGIASFEIRFRSQALARWFGAQGAYWYYERDGENINWQWKDFFRNPLKAVAQDLKKPRNPWNYDQWKAVPSLSAPTHALGLQIHWPRWQLGAEFRDNDTNRSSPSNYQTYENGGYPSGHSRLGDCMGFMLGGTTAWAASRSMASQRRVFRSDACWGRVPGPSRIVWTLSWQAAHPGQSRPEDGRVLLAEFGLQQALPSSWRWGLALGLKRERSLEFVPGTSSGCNLSLSLVKRL